MIKIGGFMNKSTIFFVMLSLWVGSALAMESGSKQEMDSSDFQETEKSTLKTLFQRISNNTGDANNFSASKSKSFKYQPNDSNAKMFKKILTECAIDEVKEVLDQEMNPNDYSVRMNLLLLVGIPGVGKTTLAKAIACELGNCFFVTSGDLLAEHRNATSERLKNIVNSILNERGKKILVLDEINKLLENYTSEYKDASETASTLWEIMDAQKDNLDFFLIATANESKKLPIQIQDRFGMSVIGIQRPTNRERRALIVELLSRVKMRKHELFEQYIDRLVELTENYTPRELLHLVGQAEKKARLFDNKNPVLRKESFEQAFQVRNAKYQQFWNHTLPISEEERRHKESLNQQKEINENNLKFQDKQFIQQLKKRYVSEFIEWKRNGFWDSDGEFVVNIPVKEMAILKKSLTPEQLRLLDL